MAVAFESSTRVEWMTVAEAARLLGLSERAIRFRVTRGQMEHREETNALGKKRYLVAVEVREELDIAPAAVRQATPGEREALLADALEYCREHELSHRRGFMAWTAADPNNRPNWRTLFKWQAAVAKEERKRMGRPRTGPTLQTEVAKRFEELFLQAGGPNVSTCYRVILAEAAQHGWQVPVYKTFVRYADGIPEELKVLRHEGRDAHEAKYSRHGRRDYGGLEPHDIWVADHTPTDVYVTDEDGKQVVLQVTSIQDVASRAILAWRYTAQPDSGTVLSVLREAIAKHGKPRTFLTDQGSDFKGRNVTASLTQLGISVKRARAYHGRSKPIERTFRTVKEELKMMPGFRGTHVSRRPEEVDVLRASGELPTAAQLREVCDHQVALYHARPHRGQGMDGLSPLAFLERWVAEGGVRRRVKPETLDQWTLPHAQRQLRNNGEIEFEKTFYRVPVDFDLAHKGRKVTIRFDREDLSKLSVYDEAGDVFLGYATKVELTAWDSVEAMKTGATETRQHAELLAARAPRDLSHEERIAALSGGAGATITQLPTGQVVEPSRSPLDAQTEDIKRAREQAERGAELQAEALERMQRPEVVDLVARQRAAEREAEEQRVRDDQAQWDRLHDQHMAALQAARREGLR